MSGTDFIIGYYVEYNYNPTCTCTCTCYMYNQNPRSSNQTKYGDVISWMWPRYIALSACWHLERACSSMFAWGVPSTLQLWIGSVSHHGPQKCSFHFSHRLLRVVTQGRGKCWILGCSRHRLADKSAVPELNLENVDDRRSATGRYTCMS